MREHVGDGLYGGSMWSLEVFETDDGVQPYARFIDSLPDFKFAALDAAVERVLAA